MRLGKSTSAFSHAMVYHRRWLESHSLLGRPWFILGSAPRPTLPSPMPQNAVYAYVKYAGRSAQQHNLRSADISLLNWKSAPNIESKIDFGLILRIKRRFTLPHLFRRLTGSANTGEAELLREERDSYVSHALGSLFSEVGVDGRPSSGITLISFALSFGIPNIIVSGISLDSTGHEYDPSGARRQHVPEDRAALNVISLRYPEVSTTEVSLHESTGLPLWQSSI